MKKQKDECELNKENRNLLANYVSALSESAVPIKAPVKKSKTPKSSSTSTSKSSSIETQPPPQTLQDALKSKHLNFIRRSQRRVEILKQSKEQRLEIGERRKQWLKEMATMSPRTQKTATNPVDNVKVIRLFNYRTMVENSRNKYHKLPGS